MESMLNGSKVKMMASSTGLLKHRSQICPIKFKPDFLEFQNIEINQKYQMQITIRNEGQENEKIRYIAPSAPYFTMKSEINPFIIAPGLSFKLTFYFQLKGTDDCSRDSYEDSVLVIGNSFKKQIALRATKPNFELLMPKIYKLGLLKLGKQSKYSIPISNIGKEDVEIGMMQTSSPTVFIENSKIIVKKQNKSELHIKVKRTTIGPISQHIYFPNGESIQLKGICTDETIQVYNKEGETLKEHNFGVIFVGEKVVYPFYIANSSSMKVEGLVKVFCKSLVEYSNLKVDLSKMAFVSRSNPKKAIEEENIVNFKCMHQKFSIEPFLDFENQIIAQKEPTPEELKLFTRQAFNREEVDNRQSAWHTLVQLTQVLYIKIMNIEQPIKIPLEFSPVLPKLFVSNDKFQFFDGQPKMVSKKSFKVKNCNERAIKIKLESKGVFFFEGDTSFSPWEEKEFKICFRPLMAGQFSQQLKLSLFDVWVINLKVYGECSETANGEGNRENKENFKIILRKNGSLDTSKSSRYLSEQRKKRIQAAKINDLKNKLTQRISQGFLKKNADDPIDLAFDAGQNPKPAPSNLKFDIRTISSGLFFNKQQFSRTTAQKRKTLPLANARLNVKEIVKFSEELTPYELSKIQVKCDRLDFGSVFVGSSCQKELVINNKNNRTILLELDVGHSEAISETKGEIKKVEPYGQAKFTIKLKPNHLGTLRIPLCYIINKQHIFEIDVIANVTLINLGFSTTQLDFNFAQNDPNLEKLQTLIVTNYGTTTTRFLVIEPNNKAFSVVGNKEQEVLPNSNTNVVVKYKPLEANQTGDVRVDSDKLIVKVIGGAENIIKCEGTIFEPKYTVKQTEVNFNEIFISMPQQGKLTLRNNSKFQTAIKIELSPSSLSEVISLDQKNFILNCDERKEINFTMMSHEVRLAKGHFIIYSRGGKTYRIPISINFCFPLVEVVGANEVDLGTVHIMTNHFEREITLINQMKTQIKLQTNREDYETLDYIIQFIAAHEKVELTLRDTYQDSEKDEEEKNQFRKKSICIEDKIVTASKIKNPKNISKIITLSPGVQTKFKMKFVPKVVKQYQLKIPLYMHKSTRQIEPIPQKIKCKAVEPLFYVNPYSITFSNVIISENEHTHKREFEIINPHSRAVDWQIKDLEGQGMALFSFEESKGKIGAKESKKVCFYFHPTKEGVYSQKIKLFSNLDPEIEVELEINGNAVSPRISFNKNLLILPIVPIKTESKSIVDIENYGYEAVSISKAKFAHTMQGIDLKFTFLDGKLLSLAKKRLKIEISFKSQIPISFTTSLQIYDEYGDKLSLPISATADNCILTTYPYLEMNNSTVIYDNTENMLKLLVSKTFSSKNRQTNISGSSAVTGNFIKKWCNYELNIHMENFPDGLVESRGELLYEMIIKMTNGRPIIKKPAFTSEQKLSRMLQLHSYYSQTIKVLQTEGAFLNHIRPQYLLNLNDYLLYMFHKEYIIEQDEFECISHDAWTVLFYQLCKLYVEPVINDKFVQKFNYRHKADKGFNSLLYSESQLYVLGFLNQFLGEDKICSMSDQAKIFEVIQRILEKTFHISLGEQLSKLKINADSLVLHEFLILVSKFLFSHLREFGLSMYLQPNDLFTMGHKEFMLFFISLMQNLLNFQTHSVVQFESASGERNQKIIELENPSKRKKIKYWVKLYGSPNFKANQKQLQIEPQQTKMLKITYHCKKNSNEQAQLILVPMKDEDYFTHAHCLNFMLKNILISKTVMKKTSMKVHIYEIRSINLDVDLPDTAESAQYEVKLIGSSFVDEQEYPNYYLVQPGIRVIRNGKDKCEVKIAALQLGELSFKLILVSTTFQQYIYEYSITVTLPNPSPAFTLQPMTTDKQQKRTLKLPIENDQKQQCLRFHKEMNKEKDKDKDRKRRNQTATNLRIKGKGIRNRYEVGWMEESVFGLAGGAVEIGVRDKGDKDKADGLNKIELTAEFTKPYRQYRSLLLVKNEQLNDYRIYPVTASVSIRPKIFNIKLTSKAREVARFAITNKMSPYTFRLEKNVPELRIQASQASELVAIFSPLWVMKEEVELYVESPETFEQNIYKIKLEGKLPDPISTVTVVASTLFPTPFQIPLSCLQLPQKQLLSLKLHSQISRKSSLTLHSSPPRIAGTIEPSPQQQQSSLKLLIPKSEQYYEFMVNIKNTPAIHLGVVKLVEAIGEVRRHPIREIGVGEGSSWDYEPETFLGHQYVSVDSNGKSYECFCIVFKPTKELQCQKTFKFKSNNKEYIATFQLSSKKLQPTPVPVIITENLDKKSALVIVANHYDVEGTYETYIEDDSRFKVENHTFEMRNKDKVQLKINFVPKSIGDCSKTRLILRSKTLPELTYCLEGISKFKCKQVEQQIEGYEGMETLKQLTFTNEFPDKQRFRFEIVSSQKDYSFDSDLSHFTRDIEPGESVKFVVKNKSPAFKEQGEDTKITVLRLANRKIVKEYQIILSVVKNLETKSYNWECRARQTIFQTIRLPESYALKSIRTDPQIQKSITFNIDQKFPNEAKLKFSPLKPVKARLINILLISNNIKFRILCHVKVSTPPIDDTIVIRTAEIKETGVAVFKLTNVVREPVGYRAYFQRGYQELEVEPVQGMLQAYGKGGTPLALKFKSDVHNKKVEDRLIVETDNMYWVFRVIGMQEKILNF